jgi:AAA family ATP:ADP antiporter
MSVAEEPTRQHQTAGGLLRLVDIKPGEMTAVVWSFLYFFFVLASYYTLRPIRDAMAVAGGVSNMQWLFTATFIMMLLIVPLYGLLTSRLSRHRFLPAVYVFFIVNILLFYALFRALPDDTMLPRVFYVWVSIFNLFIVSVFWSFMADVYQTTQARRLFGVIAAGGSAGAVIGPLLTRQLVELVAVHNMLLISALLLGLALACQLKLINWTILNPRPKREHDPAKAMGGSAFAGAKLVFKHPFLAAMAGFMILGTMTGSMLYFQQAQVISERFTSPAEITAVFASVDLAINASTILIQLLLTARIISWLGLGLTLALLPMAASAGFMVLSAAPVMVLIVAVQVIRRAILFAITNPAANMLYTVVGPQSKYKFKHFTDTVVYRAGDTTGAWIFTMMMSIGAGLGGVSSLGVVLGLAWTALALWLGRTYYLMRKRGDQLP